MYKRVLKTLAALFLGTGQEFLFQILSAVLWIKFWGVELYSEWLLLSLLPTLILRGNAGVFHGATSKLIGQFNKNDFPQAKLTYEALKLGQLWFLLIVACLYGIAAFLVESWAHFQYFSKENLVVITVLFISQFAIYQWQQTILSLVKANGMAPTAVMWQNYWRLANIVCLLGGSMFAGPITCLALAVLAQAIVAKLTTTMFGKIRNKLALIYPGDLKQEVRFLLYKGLQFSLFSFGPTMLHVMGVWALGGFWGASIGAAYHNMRMISRSGLLCALAGEQALRLEFSSLFAKYQFSEARLLIKRSITLAILFAGLVSGILILIGEDVFVYLTHGKLEFAFFPYIVLCGGSFIATISNIYLAVPFSLNRHGAMSRIFFLIIICTTMACLPAASGGMLYVAMVILLAEFALWYFAKATSLNIINELKPALS